MESHCIPEASQPSGHSPAQPLLSSRCFFPAGAACRAPAFHGGSHSLYTMHRRPRHRNLELTCFEPSDNAPYEWESDELPARSSTPSAGTQLP